MNQPAETQNLLQKNNPDSLYCQPVHVVEDFGMKCCFPGAHGAAIKHTDTRPVADIGCLRGKGRNDKKGEPALCGEARAHRRMGCMHVMVCLLEGHCRGHLTTLCPLEGDFIMFFYWKGSLEGTSPHFVYWKGIYHVFSMERAL